jgi:hypothetical protein
VSFRIAGRRAGGLPGSQRRRQDHHPQDPLGAAPPFARRGHRRRVRAAPPPHAFLKTITLVMGRSSSCSGICRPPRPTP